MSGMIDLKITPKKMDSTVEPATPYYPSLHISDVDLPISDTDVGKELVCNVKLRVNSVEKRAVKGKKTCSCSFDVMGIALNKAKMTTEKMKGMSSSELDDLEEQEYNKSISSLNKLGKGK